MLIYSTQLIQSDHRSHLLSVSYPLSLVEVSDFFSIFQISYYIFASLYSLLANIDAMKPQTSNAEIARERIKIKAFIILSLTPLSLAGYVSSHPMTDILL